jgi:hypothetical protein
MRGKYTKGKVVLLELKLSVNEIRRTQIWDFDVKNLLRQYRFHGTVSQAWDLL